MSETSQPILNTIVADVNAIVPNLSSLVSSYRLLVGSAEEISRSPAVPRDVYERAVIRYDRAGTLIDILLELLCCKIRFVSEFLSVTCAPVDIFSLAQNPLNELTVEQIIELEVLRRILKTCCYEVPCFDEPVHLKPNCEPPCPKPTPPPSPAPPPPAAARSTEPIEIDNEVLQDLLTQAGIILPIQEEDSQNQEESEE